MTKLTLLTVTLFLAVGVHLSVAQAPPVNRWSFSGTGSAPAGTVIADSVSGADGVIVGNGASFNGSELELPGTTNGDHSPATIAAYVDLPNGLASSKSDLTLEIWATVGSVRNWQRLFDFGRMDDAGMGPGAADGEITPGATTAPGGTVSSDNLMLAINRGSDANTQRLTGRLNGAGELLADSGATINPGTEYHFAIVVEQGIGSSGAEGSQVRWYLNGALVQTRDLNFHLSAIEDVNNWLGRSQYSGDSQSHIAYNEFRIYDEALTVQEISASAAAGPDATFPPPTTQPDSVALNPGGKVRVPVLANDSDYLPTTVEIVTPPEFGTVLPDSAGRILYAHTSGTPTADSFTYRVRGAGGFSAPATVTIHFTDELRLENDLLHVPAAPPPTAYRMVDAFPEIGFNQPICIVSPPDETHRLFICEKGGRIRLIPDLGDPTDTELFLNLPTLLSARGESLATDSEQGLLGLAFHPDYDANGFFFVYYSVQSGGSHYQRVSRFSVEADNPDAADPDSEVILFQQIDSAGNHNGGDLHFGPDGYLYISIGDGGNANDSQGHAQKIDEGFFAAIARIDVDRKPGSLEPNPSPGVPLYSGVAAYAIPADNPFVGATSFNGSSVNPDEVRTELWAVGLRNPWRMSFDPATGQLWCGDVGQGRREEVNLIIGGGNYGWPYREGTLNGPKGGPPRFDSIDPVYEYSRGSGTFEGNSITGGVVYHGSQIPSLQGAYLFGDYGSGNIWSLRGSDSDVNVERIAGHGGIVAFGTDPSNGDLLAADLSGGHVMRLTSETPPGAFPLTLSETGLFVDVADLSPAPGLVSYEPNLSFWSDHAEKRRWFTIPDAGSQMTWSNDGLWTFPEGQIWVKHFDMEMEEGNPASTRRLETRLLVHGDTGFYGVSYQWNEAQTDATLVPDAGATIDLAVTTADGLRNQVWQIPSRASCMACHTPEAGYALSFTTRQLNREGTVAHMVGNQLELLHDAGYFANSPEPVNTLPRHVRPDETEFSLEARVRSYLEVNCVSCHTPGGSSGASWDSRASTPLFETGLIHGMANNNGGDPENKLIVPGDPDHSILLHRVAATNGFTRMPPIATSELDDEGIALLTEWLLTYDERRMPFRDWQLVHFGSTDDPDAALSADPDGDGLSNHQEYLHGTSPLEPDAHAGPVLEVTADDVATLNYNVSPNATARVQVSTNLVDWLFWNAVGNDGIRRAGDLQTMSGAVPEERAFFRLLLEEL